MGTGASLIFHTRVIGRGVSALGRRLAPAKSPKKPGALPATAPPPAAERVDQLGGIPHGVEGRHDRSA